MSSTVTYRAVSLRFRLRTPSAVNRPLSESCSHDVSVEGVWVRAVTSTGVSVEGSVSGEDPVESGVEQGGTSRPRLTEVLPQSLVEFPFPTFVSLDPRLVCPRKTTHKPSQFFPDWTSCLFVTFLPCLTPRLLCPVSPSSRSFTPALGSCSVFHGPTNHRPLSAGPTSPLSSLSSHSSLSRTKDKDGPPEWSVVGVTVTCTPVSKQDPFRFQRRCRKRKDLFVFLCTHILQHFFLWVGTFLYLHGIYV